MVLFCCCLEEEDDAEFPDDEPDDGADGEDEEPHAEHDEDDDHDGDDADHHDDDDDHDDEGGDEEGTPGDPATMARIERLAQFQPAQKGPVETFVELANKEFKAATAQWEAGSTLKYARELEAELLRLEKAEGGGKKGKKGKKKSGKKSSKKKSKKSGKKSGKKGKGKEKIEKAPPTAEELLAKEDGCLCAAIDQYRTASNLYIRAVKMCLASKKGVDHHCYISCCLNAGESLVRVGDQGNATSWIGAALEKIEQPGGASGQSRETGKRLVVPEALVWWSEIIPPPEAKKKKKKGSKKKGSKKKKKGSKKGSKKKKK